MKRRTFVLASAAACTLRGVHAAAPPRAAWPHASLAGARPLVIAHRGACGERPEHTLAAYERALDQGADYLEIDVVCTADGHLVARHDRELSVTTDVATRPQFAARRATKVVDGREQSGWFVEDFALAEVQVLRARERWPQLRPDSAAHDGRYPVPTLAQIVELAQRKQAARGRRIGLYPETKDAAFFAARDLALEPRLVALLASAGYRAATDPVFLQSFEPSSLKKLAALTPLARVQLIAERGAPPDAAQPHSSASFAAMLGATGLAHVATYAQALGVTKNLVIPRDAANRLGTPTDLTTRAHALGLAVHVWTMRSEDRFLPADLQGEPQIELERFLAAGVDGLITDHPAAAVGTIARLTLRN